MGVDSVVVDSRRAAREVVKVRMGSDDLSCFVHCRHRASGRALFSNAIVLDGRGSIWWWIIRH